MATGAALVRQGEEFTRMDLLEEMVFLDFLGCFFFFLADRGTISAQWLQRNLLLASAAPALFTYVRTSAPGSSKTP